MTVRAVFFDIGETLIDETRTWSALADWLSVPRMTMFAVLGRIIANKGDHKEVFPAVRPDLTAHELVETLESFRAAVKGRYLPEDLYPDVRPSFQELKEAGLFIGIAGNQPTERRRDLQEMNLSADLIATSQGWGVKKPDPGFFERIASESGFRPEEIAYVGDRVDNDVVPASDAGMVSIHIVRGAWGFIQQDWIGVKRARAQVRSLTGLPELIEDP